MHFIRPIIALYTKLDAKCDKRCWQHLEMVDMPWQNFSIIHVWDKVQKGSTLILWDAIITSTHTHTHTGNHFTAFWTLSRTIQVSCSQKIHFAIFWIFWCKMKITHQQFGWTATPSRLIGASISAISAIFTPDALPGTTLTIYPRLGQWICWLAYSVARLLQNTV